MSEFTGTDKLQAMSMIAKVGYDEGVKDERERIIELLETDCKNGSIEFAIELIKGENK